jgi:MFS superfamily sulfate permease-like transporter
VKQFNAYGPGAQRRSGFARPEMFSHVRDDFFSSLVVFLVALPLCIGIAVAVGVSPARALITGIIGGMVVGLLSGAPLQVSGPAAGLFVIVADILSDSRARFLAGHDLDSLSQSARAALESQATEVSLITLGVAVFLGGCLQLFAGRLGLGQWFRAVSPAVINGMLAGIGVLILASQFHVMLDHQPMWGDTPAHGGLEYLGAIPEAIRKAVAPANGNTHHLAAAAGLITIGVILLWQRFSPRSLRLIPAPLVGIAAATVFALVMNLPIAKLNVPQQFFSETTLPSMQSIQLAVEPPVLLAALVIALVASAETLLCATAIDQIQTRVRTNYDRELSSQGIGNMLCGLVGALPMTGVIVRSSANVHAGAKTRLSSVLHGVWLLIFVALFPFVLTYIPKAALGALLVYIGWKLVDIKHIRKLWSISRAEAGIYLATMTIIVVEDLLVGVVVGLLLSAAKLLNTFTQLETDLVAGRDKSTLHLVGAATFIRLPKLAAALENAPQGTELHVDMHQLKYVDHACLELLMAWARRHEAAGGTLVIDWDSLHAKFSQTPTPMELPVPQEAA